MLNLLKCWIWGHEWVKQERLKFYNINFIVSDERPYAFLDLYQCKKCYRMKKVKIKP